ncbi:hypothetical protein [Halococcus sediminicola]|uniref:hypothetical protein n=1 Tax=Halococcus sediminicola TaxID=1264579 RepID=UPI0006791A28|nr:hypothetical protein [Halococcus sediminicola]
MKAALVHDADPTEISVADYYGLGEDDDRALVAYAPYVGPAPDNYDVVKDGTVRKPDETANDPADVTLATYQLGDRLPAGKVTLAEFQAGYGTLALINPTYGQVSVGGTNMASLSHSDIEKINRGARSPDPDAPAGSEGE